ncbi:hypothetical protein Zmor_002902 [Zophobas morio]|uniref:Uncharacterized protein n=1 Tax=Zophobas morio TaxID=2755281 RepID=A0AA38M0T2_9CUCU|nr:hypothetical protein Zmor_002902 [Zophobas morio]
MNPLEVPRIETETAKSSNGVENFDGHHIQRVLDSSPDIRSSHETVQHVSLVKLVCPVLVSPLRVDNPGSWVNFANARVTLRGSHECPLSGTDKWGSFVSYSQRKS